MAAQDSKPVADYYDRIHRTTWVRRVAGTMAGATLGIGYGGLVGMVAAYIPYTLGALGVAGAAAVSMPGIMAAASTAALFAGAGAFIGMLLASDVGANAGAVAAGLEEKERREHTGATGRDLSPASVSAQQSISNGPQNFSWRVGAICAPLFAAFGALIAYNPHPGVSSALAMMTGSAGGLSGTAAMVASAAIFGMFGTFIGCKNAKFSNNLSNFYTKLISDKYFTPEQSPSVAPSIAVQPTPEPVMDKAQLQAPTPDKKFSLTEKAFSPQEFLVKRENKVSSSETAWVRT